MVRQPKPRKRSRADLLRDACQENYDGYTQDSTKEEIARLSKVNFSLVEDKKAVTKSMNEVIKDNQMKVEYLVEKLDALRHDVAVAHHLEQAES